jgi:hypothetical protein
MPFGGFRGAAKLPFSVFGGRGEEWRRRQALLVRMPWIYMKNRALVRLDRFFGSFSQNQPCFGKSFIIQSYANLFLNNNRVTDYRIQS